VIRDAYVRYVWAGTIVAVKQLPFPVSTERLTVRFFEDRDRELELAIHGDGGLFIHLPIEPRAPAEIDESLRKRVGQHALDEVGGMVSLAIERTTDGSYVGAVQLNPLHVEPLQVSIGWLALRAQHGNGFMTEAVGAVLNTAFGSAGVHRIVADITAGNDASVRLAERLGFRKEAHFVQSVFLRDEWRDEMVYALLASDWDA
jgi:RimJ/RimL family protein N-acetyltransferase